MDKAILKIECVNNLKANRFRKNKSATSTKNASTSDNYIDIDVQYNPSSIKYSGSTKMRNEISDIKDVVSYSNTLDMSFTLVFHSQVDSDQSVQEKMELVMNTICDSSTRNVKFLWANMYAEGRLTSFSGKYDMFDANGNPISGQMDITIRLRMDINEIRKILGNLNKTRNQKTKQF